MTKPLTAEQKTLEILRGNYPYTTETLPMEYYTEICEGSESTAELLRDMLTPIKEKSYFCQEWVTYMSGFDGDFSEVKRQRNNYRWARDLWDDVTRTITYLNEA
jgi:hypothetical protein